MSQISTLFASDIDRRIEEVIKVDQDDEDVVALEIEEYIVTDTIKRHFRDILERYLETPQKPHEGIAIWVSGFFGSGKSSFAKMLGLSIGNRTVLGEGASDRFTSHVGDNRLTVVLKGINERIPTHTVIFDVSTDRGIRSGNQMLREIMYRLFLESLGYAKDLDLAELEIDLETKGRLAEYETAFERLHGKPWAVEKGMLAFALGQASATLHAMMPEVFPQKDSWSKGRPKLDVTAGGLADRIVELMKRRKPGQSLIFVVDEVGQFVARDVQKMLDLQAIVQQLGVKGRGKHWIVVTSQEKLGELVGGLDDKRIELARLMDRFPQELQVHLEPSDISEVTSQRVLRKNAAAEADLGRRFDEHRPRLALHSRISADITLPELSRQAFMDLYPLLPYQIVLIIDIVSGLRTQGGSSKHVGGANRTIIKLAQQLLINPSTKLADQPIGALVRLDHVYDLIDSNIASEIRAKIASIPQRVQHPMAQAVAKVVCLLQFVKTVHRTPENIAAALLAYIDGASPLAEVKEALADLEKALMVRQGDGGYRIPTPAEDDWDQSRSAIGLRAADRKRILSEAMRVFWAPQPAFSLGDTKQFRAGLMVNGTDTIAGDITFNLQLIEDAAEATKTADELRRRSQLETRSVFWVVTLDGDIEREALEAYRSDQMINRKSRGATTADETKLIAEEGVRLKRHQDELRRRLRIACLDGQVYFRGNDRSPDDKATDVGRAAAAILGQLLPTVYDRFQEASAKGLEIRKGLDALFGAANLSGLPTVFTQLGLLRDERGKPVFRTDVPPLAEIMNQIDAKATYGDQATGKFLEDEFSKAPFGWDLESVRLFVMCLLRAGRVEAVSKGQTIDSATSVQAKECFTNNNLFRAANFRPKKGIDFAVLVESAEHFKATFGNEIRELTAATIVAQLRAEVERHEEPLDRALATLRDARLPGTEMLENALSQMRAIRKAGEESAISTFLAGHRSIKDAIQRGADLDLALTEPALRDIERARAAIARMPALRTEADLDRAIVARGDELADLLGRETFFRDLAAIDQYAAAIEAEFRKRLGAALDARVGKYLSALETLHATPGWERLDEAQQQEISRSLSEGAKRTGAPENLAHLRSETEACNGRLSAAISRLHQVLEGERLATVSLAPFFAGGIETEEQLDQALSGVRDAFSRLIGEGKMVIVQ